MPVRQSLTLMLFLCGLSFVAGCGSGSATVGGAITVDGQPLKKGFIVFAPADSKGEPVTTAVENGRYAARVVPGKKRVQISEILSAGKKKEHNGPNAPWVEVTKEGLPPRYNVNTELQYDVAAGSNTKDWSLARKPGKEPPANP